MALQTGERMEFADFYKELVFLPAPAERAVCSGPIAYIGAEEVANDLATFRAALAESGAKPEETIHVRPGARLAGAFLP